MESQLMLFLALFIVYEFTDDPILKMCFEVSLTTPEFLILSCNLPIVWAKQSNYLSESWSYGISNQGFSCFLSLDKTYQFFIIKETLILNISYKKSYKQIIH